MTERTKLVAELLEFTVAILLEDADAPFPTNPLERIYRTLKIIERQTSPYFPVEGVLLIGERKMFDSQKVPYAIFELDAKGVPVLDPGDSAAVTVDAPTGSTIVPDTAVDPSKILNGFDPAKCLGTGFIVGGSTAGTANVTATFAHTDGTPAPPPATVAIPVTAGVPATGTIQLGAPVSQ